jgi:hypothetical protein
VNQVLRHPGIAGLLLTLHDATPTPRTTVGATSGTTQRWGTHTKQEWGKEASSSGP